MAMRLRALRGLRALATQFELTHIGLQSEIQALSTLPQLRLFENKPLKETTPPFPIFRSYSQNAPAESAQETIPDSSEMSETHFHKLSDLTMDDIFERIEQFVDELDLDEDADVEYSQGVLTVKLGGLGTYVINKQTPNRQIWLSSPVSGPFRYDFYKGSWVYRRDGHKMHERLEKEFEQLTGQSIDLNPCSTCGNMNACLEGNYCLK